MWRYKLATVVFSLDAARFYFYSSIIQTINLIHLQNARGVTQPRSRVGVFSSSTGEPSFLPTVTRLQAMISIIIDLVFVGLSFGCFCFYIVFLTPLACRTLLPSHLSVVIH